MNAVALVGRLTKDPDVRYTTSQVCVARFTLAVDRRFKREGVPDADFIGCVAFGKTAEFINKYFSKGRRMGLTGRIQTGRYTDKDGKTIYTTDVVCENAEFVDSRKDADQGVEKKSSDLPDGFAEVPDNVQEELPFM